MMDDDEKDGAKRAEPARQSKKSVEEVLKRVARPAWRSPLFWWLVEHHDALRQNEAETGRGVPWQELCVDFVGLGITLADGRPVKPATARITWQRVRKEVVRVEERRARERAEREARRAVDPRRNMPSRFSGSFPAPLAERQPPLRTTSPTAKLPATTARQAAVGLQLSTAEGVVVTKVTRVFKLREDGDDYVFSEDGSILPSTNLASALTVRQQMNISSGLPVNDKTERLYAELELRSEYR
jgi:hypothetical protein